MENGSQNCNQTNVGEHGMSEHGMSKRGISRRGFLTGAAGAGAAVALGGLAACAPKPAAESDTVIEEANSTVDWLGVEPEITDIAETLECDVLVCGGGTGGLFAACAAAEEGAHVIVVEKSPAGGGIRDNVGSFNSRLQQEAHAELDKEELLTELYRAANGYCDPRLHRLWADMSGETVDWYQDRIEERGLQLFYEADDTHSPTRFKHFATGHIPSWPADAEFAGIPVEINGKTVLGDYFASQGGEARFETSLVKLIRIDGVITGAIVKDRDERFIQINASKGVVVSTGGYAWNQDMLNALQPQTQKLYSLCIAVPGVVGDGIKACLWAGASMDETHAGMVFDRVAVKPDELGGNETMGKMMWIGSNPWLKVNLRGERYCNESAPYTYVASAATSQPNQTWCTIWDSDWEKYIVQFDIHGCARVVPFDNGAPTNVSLEVERGMNEALIEEGYIQVADTIEELAQKLNIPVDTFKETVDRQNENFDNQIDPDFGKEPFRLSALRTPPFFGARTSGYLLCTLNGIRIDTNMAALDAEGNPLAGLYVVGNDSGSYFSGVYPNLLTGAAAGRTTTFGRRVGKLLAAK